MTLILPKMQEFINHYPTSPICQKLKVIIRKDKTKNELIRYSHACCFSPQVSTFISSTYDSLNLFLKYNMNKQILKTEDSCIVYLYINIQTNCYAIIDANFL